MIDASDGRSPVYWLDAHCAGVILGFWPRPLYCADGFEHLSYVGRYISDCSYQAEKHTKGYTIHGMGNNEWTSRSVASY